VAEITRANMVYIYIYIYIYICKHGTTSNNSRKAYNAREVCACPIEN